jgi:hypothetical protein
MERIGWQWQGSAGKRGNDTLRYGVAWMVPAGNGKAWKKGDKNFGILHQQQVMESRGALGHGQARTGKTRRRRGKRGTSEAAWS